jgi:hypothetical protein
MKSFPFASLFAAGILVSAAIAARADDSATAAPLGREVMFSAVAPPILAMAGRPNSKADASARTHVVVASKAGRFLAWPANNGVWTWDGGREILVGHSNGPWEPIEDGHKIGSPILTNLVRSLDGGRTWASEDPENFVGDGGAPQPSPGDIDFSRPGFALRVAAMGYHGTDDAVGAFFFSYDRGKTWRGPFRFNGLMDDANLQGMENTSRTSYLVTGPNSCLVFGAARKTGIEFASRLDKPFVAETTDGGKTFRFVSWMVPWTDPHRAVMPSTVRMADGRIVAAVRRRNPRDDNMPCWIDAFGSSDNGRTWSFLSRIGETGMHNGNPPGLAVLGDGRLACAYGNRTVRQMLVRFSTDGGATWGEEMVLRDQPNNHDIGYPVLRQNADGDLVAIYYFQTNERNQSYLEATIWKP